MARDRKVPGPILQKGLCQTVRCDNGAFLSDIGNPAFPYSGLNSSRDLLIASSGHKGPPYKSGGKFIVSHVQTDYRPVWGSDSHCAGNIRYIVNGHICLLPRDPTGDGSFKVINSLPEAVSFDSEGPGLYAKASPFKAQAGLGQAIAELHKLPELLQFRLRNFRDIGHDYLNVEFGWKPFLNDMRDAFNSIITVEKRLKQLARDNGKPIRRRASKVIENTTYSESGYNPPVLSACPSRLAAVPGSGSSTWTRRKDVRFTARFRYWIPTTGPEASIERAYRALQVLGALPTPKLVWDLMPWSWLIDWFSNIGDVIENVSTNAADNLVCEYGFMTSRTRISSEQFGKAMLGLGGATVSPLNATIYDLSVSYSSDYKNRSGCNPFGFGATWNSLSARQNLILAALGLART
jgi:hypothetical protein